MTPDYAAFEHANVSGGIASGETSKSGAPLVILYASKLEEAQARVEKAGGKIVKPIFSFPGGAAVPLHRPRRQRTGDLVGSLIASHVTGDTPQRPLMY